LRAVIIGGGPVGCLAAIELRKRSFDVEIYERGPDIRMSPPIRGHSFNLTLTRRGLDSLDEQLLKECHSVGIPLPQRVIHHRDGRISYQAYGVAPDHYLLSVPRGALHLLLLAQAHDAGARLFFHHELVGMDPATAKATFIVEGTALHEAQADLLIGADGANSLVRHMLSRSGAPMWISQEQFSDGFVEVSMPSAEDGSFALLEERQSRVPVRGSEHGLHVWPRGDFMLLAQPNTDRSYTTGLWMPLDSPGPEKPSWATTREPEDVRRLFGKHFSDVLGHLPTLAEDVLARPPALLKTTRCTPYHHQRAVLLGDAAHTLVPFYGQGINCSFEDVSSLIRILERHLRSGDPRDAIGAALPEFTRTRQPAGNAIADLSLAMSTVLKKRTDEPQMHARARLEYQLHTYHPELFVPLYHGVAFTHTPYHEVVATHERQNAILDDLCRRFDGEQDTERIIDAYVSAARRQEGATAPAHNTGRPDAPWPDLTLSPDQQRELLHAVAGRLAGYQTDLANRAFPASYREGDSVSPVPAEPSAPQHGTGLDRLLDEIFEEALPSGMMHAHPGFLAHVPSGGLFQGAVGEFVARSLNRFAGAWEAAPGFVQIESNVVRWFCEAMGYGEGSFGYLTTGGSIANFMALRCALERLPEEERPRAAVYVSEDGHFSVSRAAKLAGIRSDLLRVVPSDAGHRMETGRLRAYLEEDRARGIVPACVVATAGTTNTGAVDDLPTIAAITLDHRVWMHVDACFGGFFRLTERGRRMLAGTELADSIAVDAHKSLFLPHGNSALLVRDGGTLRDTFSIGDQAYIPELSGDEERVDFMNFGPEVTREIRGLTAWLPIKLHGIAAFRRSLDRVLDLADDLAARLEAMAETEVLPRATPHLPTVVFQVRTAASGEAGTERSDRFHERLGELIRSRGNVYVTTSSLPGQGRVLRICIMHHQTDEQVIDRLLTDLRWAMDNLERNSAAC
jgi:glutamate/tyrosine decarboxylase-like PLP-dependent enzyme/2-polyprenyl-6-methoxyphenol hydroxylase-like FAD-dependent oxidoreductase